MMFGGDVRNNSLTFVILGDRKGNNIYRRLYMLVVGKTLRAKRRNGIEERENMS